MTSLRLQPRGYGNQNLIIDKLHQESIEIASIDAMYIPRTLVAEDMILGEDRLSKFEHAYPILVYLENVEGFDGQNSFASKFGLQIDSSAKISVSRRAWDMAVSRYGKTVLPNRPCEGDLIFLPMTKGLFEINYVNHQDPFYQLGQVYTYKMTIQLFRYSSEAINTGNSAVDTFEDVHTQDITQRPIPDTAQRGADNKKFIDKSVPLVFSAGNPFGTI